MERQMIDLTLQCRPTPSPKGYLYDVFEAGELLLTSINPEFSACRAFAAAGRTGKVRFWRDGKPEHDSEFDIEKAAKFTVRENGKHAPRIGKYVPFVWPGAHV